MLIKFLWRKRFRGHILALFANFEARRSRKTNEKLILHMCLRNKFCIHIRVRPFIFTKRSKSLYRVLFQYFFQLVQARFPDLYPILCRSLNTITLLHSNNSWCCLVLSLPLNRDQGIIIIIFVPHLFPLDDTFCSVLIQVHNTDRVFMWLLFP
jgi:hypothetical protein